MAILVTTLEKLRSRTSKVSPVVLAFVVGLVGDLAALGVLGVHDVLGKAPAAGPLETLSRQFIGAHYLWGPLGEGDNSPYDREPLFSATQFDCQTFVETVLALHFSGKKLGDPEFIETLNKIRYRDGIISYEERNHFMHSEWVLNNEAFFEEYTAQSVVDSSWVQRLDALFFRPAWLDRLMINHLSKIFEPVSYYSSLDAETRRAKAAELSASFHRRDPAPVRVQVPYLPIQIILDRRFISPARVLANIPEESIILFIQSAVKAAQVNGLIVGHMGFVFKHGNRLIVREASSERGVRDTEIGKLLQKLAKGDMRYRGIRILKLRLK